MEGERGIEAAVRSEGFVMILGVSNLHFMCHISVHGYNTQSMAWLTFMLWQKTLIHSVDKEPFVSGSWEFCVNACMSPCLFSGLSHVPSVACGQTAVLPWCDPQMSECTMRLCSTLHVAAPAVRQFASAYYPEPALRDRIHDQTALMTHLK